MGTGAAPKHPAGGVGGGAWGRAGLHVVGLCVPPPVQSGPGPRHGPPAGSITGRTSDGIVSSRCRKRGPRRRQCVCGGGQGMPPPAQQSRAELGPEPPVPTPESQIPLGPESRLHRTPPATRAEARLPGRGSKHRHKHLSLTPRGPGGLLAALLSPVSPEVMLGAGTWPQGRCLQQRSWQALPPWCTANGLAGHTGQTQASGAQAWRPELEEQGARHAAQEGEVGFTHREPRWTGCLPEQTISSLQRPMKKRVRVCSVQNNVTPAAQESRKR